MRELESIWEKMIRIMQEKANKQMKQENINKDVVGGITVYVLTMTRLVCFPALLRSAYGIGLLQDSSGS